MTIKYVAEHNTKSHGKTFENNGCIKVQKSEDISDDENIINKVNSLETFG